MYFGDEHLTVRKMISVI